MLEQLIDSEEYVLDTPFLRRFRAQIEQVQKEAEQARTEARLEAHRDDILNAIAIRLNPSVLVYREIERKLAKVDNVERLQEIFTAALKAESVEVLEATLD